MRRTSSSRLVRGLALVAAAALLPLAVTAPAAADPAGTVVLPGKTDPELSQFGGLVGSPSGVVTLEFQNQATRLLVRRPAEAGPRVLGPASGQLLGADGDRVLLRSFDSPDNPVSVIDTVSGARTVLTAPASSGFASPVGIIGDAAIYEVSTDAGLQLHAVRASTPTTSTVLRTFEGFAQFAVGPFGILTSEEVFDGLGGSEYRLERLDVMGVRTLLRAQAERMDPLAQGNGFVAWTTPDFDQGTSAVRVLQAGTVTTLPVSAAGGSQIVAVNGGALAFFSTEGVVHVLPAGATSTTQVPGSAGAQAVAAYADSFAFLDSASTVRSTANTATVILAGSEQPARFDLTGLSAGRLVGMDTTLAESNWQRTLTRGSGGLGAGPESLIVTRSTAPFSTVISGSRTVFDDLRNALNVVVTRDGAGVTVPLPGNALDSRALSGPRASIGSELYDLVTRSRLRSVPFGHSLWGPFVTTGPDSGGVFSTDLDTGTTTQLVARPVGCVEADGACRASNIKRWGKYLSWSDSTGSFLRDITRPASVVANLGERVAVALDDGVAILGRASGNVVALSSYLINTGATTLLTEEAADSRVFLDDGLVAWVGTDQRVRIAEVPGYAERSAKLLGLGGPRAFNPARGSWKPELDATKSLSAWTFTVRNAAGTSVYSKTGSAPQGAVRGISWLPRASDASGLYTWSISGTTADGTGALSSLGGAALTGKVSVLRSAPTAKVVTPSVTSSVSSTLPFKVSWATGPRVAGQTVTYDVSYAYVTASGTKETVGVSRPWLTGTSLTSATFGLSNRPAAVVAGQTIRFTVKVRDNAGNLSLTSGTSVVPLDDRSLRISYSGFAVSTVAGKFLSSLHTATKAGSSASVSASVRRVVIVGDRCAACGAFDVFIGGVKVATVDTKASATASRQVLYSKTYTSVASRTLRIVVKGTAGRPSVKLDAIALQA